jgi:hypothetical protein
MFVYFSIATILAIVLIIGSIILSDHDEILIAILFIIGFWVLLVCLPSYQATDRTIVTRANPTEYRISKIDPYHSVLITDLTSDEPTSFSISDSYTLHKIETGKFRIIKHRHLNTWGEEVHMTTYFIKLLK